MEKIVSCSVAILLGVILSLVKDSVYAQSVRLGKRQIIGETIQFNGYQVNQYLGIGYAQPPVGELRFQKTQKLRSFPRIFKATTLPPACPQYSESPYPWYVNGSHKSEDCLYLNIWSPVGDCPSDKKSVFFWVHGGGFRFGSIQDPLYNGSALAAEGDIVVVTVNYRLGLLGFGTTGTDEAPGNAGLWDVLEALKWVNRNIGFFGGDRSRITIAGESAGSIAVAYFSISPLADGLFDQMIMESGSPALPLPNAKPSNLALTELIALKVGCATDSQSFLEHHGSVTKCLKNVTTEVLLRAEFEIMPRTTSDFMPEYGDDLLPKNPKNAIFNGEFRCKKLLIGNNHDEGSFLISTSAPEVFGFFGERYTQDKKVGTEIATQIMNSSLPDLISPMKSSVPDNPLLKDASGLLSDIKPNIIKDMLAKASDSSLQELSTLIGDLLLLCPDVYYAEKCADIGGDVYFYFFVHRPSTTPWAPWMGVAHYEEIQFPFGKPLLEPALYQCPEITLSADMIELWSNFVKTGKPSDDWPLYSKGNPVFRYLGNGNSTDKNGIGPHKLNCDLVRPIYKIV